MDKRSVSILIGCFMCTAIVGLMFLVAYQFSQPSCELILIEPAQHRLSALESWKSTPAKRSQDKTLLLRISAHLEYNLQSGNQPEGPFLVPQYPAQSMPLNQSNPSGQQQQQLPQAQFLQQQQATPGGSNMTQPQALLSAFGQANSGSIGRQQPMPSVPLMNATNQQLGPQSGNLNHTARSDRFLPMQLEKIEFERKHNESFYEYKLHMNCSTMSMMFVRQADKIRLSQISLELKPANQKRSRCEIVPTNAAQFELEMEPKNEGYVHYDCQPTEALKCIDRRTGDVLAMLSIHALEFETALRKEVKKKFNYSQANKCFQ